MPDFKFLNVTQNDKGAPTSKRGWLQEVNAHSATIGHARRRKLLRTRASLNTNISSGHPPNIRVKVTETEVDEHATLETTTTISTAAVNGRLQIPPKGPAPPIYRLREIISSLDPFVKLPAYCSESEKSLLSFHLRHGRRNILGTSAIPKYDISLDAARLQIQSNPIWSWVHIVVAEEILSQLTHRSKTPNFYRRRACAYADTKRLLLDDNVSIPAKLATLMMLQVMECCTGNWHLQAMHCDAIDQIIAANGGLQLFLRKNNGENDMVQPIWFLSIWRAGLFKLLPRGEFEEASSSLYDFFHELRQWLLSVRHSDIDQGQRQCDMVALTQLIKYLGDLIPTHLLPEGERSSSTIQGLVSFALILHLCGTFTRLHCDLAMATKFLIRFQEYIKDSFSDPDDSFPEASKLGVMHLNGVTSMLSHIRRQVYIRGVPLFSMGQEIQLCIVSMHAAKVFPMLCEATRLRLARRMLSCALISTQDNFVDAFSEEEIEDVRAELDMSWHQAVKSESGYARQQSLHMPMTPLEAPGNPSEANDDTWDGS